jgi:Fur family ferric uptake transcriptional regulator
VDVPDGLIDDLVVRLRDERGFTVDRSHFTVFGRCEHCSAEIRGGRAPESVHTTTGSAEQIGSDLS